MSFRKRNVALGNSDSGPSSRNLSNPAAAQPSGVRPSPLDGRPTTSTGTQSLDDLLGGYAGLPLGNAVLIEEEGTTDFAGVFLRLFAAEGVVQGHYVHVVGVGEQWGRDLPGLVAGMDSEGVRKGGDESRKDKQERMKIAWRYERLGEFGTGPVPSRGGLSSPLHFPLPHLYLYNIQFPIPETIQYSQRLKHLQLTRPAPLKPNRSPHPSPSPSTVQPTPTAASIPLQPFRHTFDLTKRLFPLPTSLLSAAGALPIDYIPLPFPALFSPSSAHPSPFTPLLQSLSTSLATSSPTMHHRVLIPLLLSPALYAPSASLPTTLLPFLHSLRALLRTHPTRLTAMLSLPLSLYPRSSGLTRWIEHLVDGVLELAPFAHTLELPASRAGAGPGSEPGATAKAGPEEKAQGMLKVHKLPVVNERGGGGVGTQGEDMVFVVGRKRIQIRPFYLPPVEATGGEGSEGGEEKIKKAEMEF